MTTIEAREKLTQPIKQATLCFLLKDDHVLLAMKKRGFGVNKYNGVGGKQNENESIVETAKREAFEEIGVTIRDMEQVATLIYIHPHKPEWNQQVMAYIAQSWDGEPTETEEMAPRWFDINAIPFDQMWSDDSYWLSTVLEGSKVEAVFTFGENGEVLEHQVKIL